MRGNRGNLIRGQCFAVNARPLYETLTCGVKACPLLKFIPSVLASFTILYALTSVPACSPVIVILPFAGGVATGVRSGSPAVGMSRASVFSLALIGFSLPSSVFGTFSSFAPASISAKADVSSIKYRSPSIGSSGTVPVAAAVCIVPISSIIITNTDKTFFILISPFFSSTFTSTCFFHSLFFLI